MKESQILESVLDSNYNSTVCGQLLANYLTSLATASPSLVSGEYPFLGWSDN
jgi:hypothetical protein